jgi:hypothetical protein
MEAMMNHRDNLFVGTPWFSQVARRVLRTCALAALFLLAGCTVRIEDARGRQDQLDRIEQKQAELSAKQAAIATVLNRLTAPPTNPTQKK